MRDEPKPEVLVAGGCVAFLVMYFVGTGLDDALGHNSRSLWIGIGVAVAVGLVVMLPTLWLAFRKDER